MDKVKIVITSLPKWSYVQWFLLGFYELQRQGKIEIKFKLPLIDRLSLYIDNYYLFGVGQRYYSGRSFCMEGELIQNGVIKKFCVDHQDSPYLFDSKLLQDVDIYFKMQCPKSFDEKGFRLNDDVWLPWTDHAHIDASVKVSDRGIRKPLNNLFENLHKVRPLMVGPRHLGYGNGYKALNRGLLKYMVSKDNEAEKKMMSYFGSSLGPVPSVDVCENVDIDYNWESDLMAKYSELFGHPNVKRNKATEILRQMGDGFDARLIKDGFSDGKGGHVYKDQIIPLDDFCEHISHFQYNLNISGYRLSIPNRFIESFMVGTAIVTDKLAVKWYKPFDEEVIETVEMGYLRDDKVDWQRFNDDIRHLPKVNKKNILKAFEDKWEPMKVASYMIEEIKQA